MYPVCVVSPCAGISSRHTDAKEEVCEPRERTPEWILAEFTATSIADSTPASSQWISVAMEATLGKINEVVSEAAGHLQSLWTEIGFNEDVCQHRQHKMVEHVKSLMTDMVEGERSLMKTLVKSIEDNGSRFYHLNKELSANLSEPEEHLSLMELERYLRKSVTEMEKEVKARRKDLEELRAREQELCECLKEDLSMMEKKAIPSKESVQDLKRVVDTLEQEKIDRNKNFLRLKNNLERLLQELEQPPTSSFECSVVTGLEDLFVLSRDNLRRLKVLNEEYEKRVEDNKRDAMKLQEQIRQLSDRLGHDPGERDRLLASLAGHTPSALFKLQMELDRLEEAKRENMELFINQLKQELEQMWEKCYVGECEREAFAPYCAEEHSEEVFEAHQDEVERLKKHHQENKKLFTTLDHWHKLWRKHLDLEERSNNPNRLFGNRGCALLQEEKERRRVKAELPRVEKEVEDLAKEYEDANSQPFLVKGQEVASYILDHWHRYHDQREQEKKERQSVRTKELLHETRSGSRPRTGSVKRQLTGESGTRKWAKQRRVQENSSPEPSSLSSMCTTPQHLGGRGILREKNQKTQRQNTVEKNGSTASSQASQDISTYSVFSNTIHLRSRRENIRSSAIYGISRTPGPNTTKRVSPRRAPQGLPRTPRTLPRAAPRRSPRLNTSRTQTRAKRNITAASPGLSAAFRSPHRSRMQLTPGTNMTATNTTTTATPTRWSKVSFLI